MASRVGLSQVTQNEAGVEVLARRQILVDNRGSGRQDSGVTNLIDMSEREYFAQFSKRTGTFIGRMSLTGVTAFMVGYDQAARRRGGPVLDGWRAHRERTMAPDGHGLPRSLGAA
jgi:hypothetical protein